MRHPWRLPPLGAKRATSSQRYRRSSGIGSSVKSRAANVDRAEDGSPRPDARRSPAHCVRRRAVAAPVPCPNQRRADALRVGPVSTPAIRRLIDAFYDRVEGPTTCSAACFPAASARNIGPTSPCGGRRCSEGPPTTRAAARRLSPNARHTTAICTSLQSATVPLRQHHEPRCRRCHAARRPRVPAPRSSGTSSGARASPCRTRRTVPTLSRRRRCRDGAGAWHRLTCRRRPESVVLSVGIACATIDCYGQKAVVPVKRPCRGRARGSWRRRSGCRRCRRPRRRLLARRQAVGQRGRESGVDDLLGQRLGGAAARGRPRPPAPAPTRSGRPRRPRRRARCATPPRPGPGAR